MAGLRAVTHEDEAHAAFRSVVEEHEGAIHAYLRRRTRDAGRAQDLSQEVFLRAWRHADRFDPGREDARGWLFTIARNLLVDTYRADAARPRTDGDQTALAALPAPEEMDAAVGAWSMAEALQRLTAAHRDVLVCLYYRRWTLLETAGHLGVAVGTVKSRSTYALRALRLVLEEMEVSE